jgi:hypothetical protein
MNYFSDTFKVDDALLEKHGAVNVSLINDMPLFIDPFLLFQSKKPKYKKLHTQIIDYLHFLQIRSEKRNPSDGDLQNLYCFKEVKQNWLGFSKHGNQGTGLSIKFARELHTGLKDIFTGFNQVAITESSHLEKLCLLSDGVGRDHVSDFTCNLIKDFICTYTETFAIKHIDPKYIKRVTVARAVFHPRTASWGPKEYSLPWLTNKRDFVLLTPRDILTRDDAWISRSDFFDKFATLPISIADTAIRSSLNSYLAEELDRRKEKGKVTHANKIAAYKATLRKFPIIADVYIANQEQNGEEAKVRAEDKTLRTEKQFIIGVRDILGILEAESSYFQHGRDTLDESRIKINYLKDVIENKGGHRLFKQDQRRSLTENDLQILMRLVWYGTPSDFGTEANDGRGPADFKVSRGATDKTIIEFKLGSNSRLEHSLKKQLEIYQRASGAKNGIFVIFVFERSETIRVKAVLKRLGMSEGLDCVIIDARGDNKPSASKAN